MYNERVVFDETQEIERKSFHKTQWWQHYTKMTDVQDLTHSLAKVSSTTGVVSQSLSP